MKTIIPVLTLLAAFAMVVILVVKAFVCGTMDAFEGTMACICAATMYLMGYVIKEQNKLV